jgi:NhaP-type Na+/H+ or K+/H+ antiporter
MTYSKLEAFSRLTGANDPGAVQAVLNQMEGCSAIDEAMAQVQEELERYLSHGGGFNRFGWFKPRFT